MKFEKLDSQVQGLLGLTGKYARKMYDLILTEKPKNILEIGFHHGKSSCFMAAALDELGGGKITTIDMAYVKNLSPSILELCDRTGLGSYIAPIFSPIGGSWELRKMIIEQTTDNVCHPLFDMCFIDAFHSWEMAGIDFTLCDKLLRPGGWMIFDDLHWSFGQSPSWSKSDKIKNMPEDYKNAKQVNDVFTYMVMQHERYGHFIQDGALGFARKLR